MLNTYYCIIPSKYSIGLLYYLGCAKYILLDTVDSVMALNILLNAYHVTKYEVKHILLHTTE